jgi:antitoxin component YwqK of YwqJK toxin-antitoxin module
MEVDIMELRELLPNRLLLFLILILGACSSEQASKAWYNEVEIKLMNNNGTFFLHDQLFTGVVYSLADNKKDTIVVGEFLNGKEDGEWRKYYSNRQLMERRYYSAGKKVGVYTGWWANGKQRLLYYFRDGEYEGNCKDWDNNGALVSSMNYKNGYESGLQQQFYANGKIKANYMMIEGRRYGLLGTKNCVNVSDSVFKK